MLLLLTQYWSLKTREYSPELKLDLRQNETE
jgi:hypothetical protein